MSAPWWKGARQRCWHFRPCDRCRDVAKIKRTGARRAALDRAINRGDLFGQLVSRLALPRRFDKVGRPEGTRPTERGKKDLRVVLVWLGRPDLSDEKIIPLLHEPVADLDSRDKRLRSERGVERIRRRVVTAYKGKDQPLLRDVAAARREIWGDVKASELRAWGRSVGADVSFGGREEPAEPEWKKAGAPSRATYYRRLRRQHRRVRLSSPK